MNEEERSHLNKLNAKISHIWEGVCKYQARDEDYDKARKERDNFVKKMEEKYKNS